MLCKRPGVKVQFIKCLHKHEGSELGPSTRVKNLNLVVFTCNPALERERNTWGLLVCQSSQIILVYSRLKKKKRPYLKIQGGEKLVAQKAKALAAKPDSLSLIPDPSGFHTLIFLSQPHAKYLVFILFGFLFVYLFIYLVVF